MRSKAEILAALRRLKEALDVAKTIASRKESEHADLLRVLRLSTDAQLHCFDGRGSQWLVRIVGIESRLAIIEGLSLELLESRTVLPPGRRPGGFGGGGQAHQGQHDVGEVGDCAGPHLKADDKSGRGQACESALRVSEVGRLNTSDDQCAAGRARQNRSGGASLRCRK